jgi:hypothetical protein
MTPLAELIQAAGLTVDQLVDSSGLEKRVVKLLFAGSYTPSPSERQRIANALGVHVDAVAWGHTVAVQHLRGNGPQTGRAT